jgi:hypothetical protein
MTQTAAVGDGPIVYFSDTGTQVLLPLSAISFDGNAVKSKPAATPSLQIWLDYLVRRGRISPGTAPAAADAMVFTAAAAGDTGNSIVVRVSPNTPDGTKVDIAVSEKDVYEGLTLATMTATLGSSGSATAGTRPGMVRVQSIATGSPDPAEGPATPVAGATTPAWTVPNSADATKASFTLEARGPGAEKGTMTIAVSKVAGAAGAKTFTLTVSWTSTITVGTADLTVSPSDAASKFAALAFAVKVSKPTGAADLKLPRTGTFSLAGGAEPAAATSAAVTVQASS